MGSCHRDKGDRVEHQKGCQSSELWPQPHRKPVESQQQLPQGDIQRLCLIKIIHSVHFLSLHVYVFIFVHCCLTRQTGQMPWRCDGILVKKILWAHLDFSPEYGRVEYAHVCLTGVSACLWMFPTVQCQLQVSSSKHVKLVQPTQRTRNWTKKTLKWILIVCFLFILYLHRFSLMVVTPVRTEPFAW